MPKKYIFHKHTKLTLYTTREYNHLIFIIISTTYKIFNLYSVTSKNDSKDWPYRMLIIGSSGSGKTNALLNLIQQDNNIIDKIYLYTKDINEYDYLIEKRQQSGQENLSDKNPFIEYSNTMVDVYENINDYNLKRKRKILIIFDDMVADAITNITITYN